MNFLMNLLGFFFQYPVQLVIFGLVFFFHLKRRKNFAVRAVFMGAGYLSLGYLRTALGLRLSSGWVTWSFLIEFVLFLVLMAGLFDVSLKEIFFYGSAVYAMQHFANAIIFSLGEVLKDGLTFLSINALVQIVCFVGFYIVLGLKVKDGHGRKLMAVKNGYVLAISVATIAVVYVLSMWAMANRVNYITRLYAMCCCLLLLFIQFGMVEFIREKEDNKKIKQMLTVEHEQHAMSKESIELINMKCHDLKHQIATLRRHVAEGKGGADYLDGTLGELEDKIMIYDSTISTGNSALDIVLTEKKLLCEKYAVKLSYVVDGAALSQMREEDVCSLFGNILDNAIESVKTVDEISKRVVSLNVTAKSGMLIIHCDNYCDRELTFVGGLPVTTKGSEEYHGYGLRSVRYITEKNGGTLSIRLVGKVFNLNLLLPLSKQATDSRSVG